MSEDRLRDEDWLVNVCGMSRRLARWLLEYTVKDLVALLRSLPRVDEEFLRGLEEDSRLRELQAESLRQRTDTRDVALSQSQARVAELEAKVVRVKETLARETGLRGTIQDCLVEERLELRAAREENARLRGVVEDILGSTVNAQHGHMGSYKVRTVQISENTIARWRAALDEEKGTQAREPIPSE